MYALSRRFINPLKLLIERVRIARVQLLPESFVNTDLGKAYVLHKAVNKKPRSAYNYRKPSPSVNLIYLFLSKLYELRNGKAF